MNKKIALVTGTRADYGIYKPVIKALLKEKLSVKIIVTGIHLSPYFGYTIKDIEKDGFEIAYKVDMLLQSDTPEGMAKSFSICCMGMTQALEQIKPDITLVLGDRGEMLAAAICSSYMNIPVAHIHGGEVSGNIDELIRHAITKFAHIHFVATKNSAERIIRLGEIEEYVYVVGAPALDTILNEKLISKEKLARKYNLDLSKDLILLSQHPVTTEIEEAQSQITQTLEAIRELGKQTIIFLPNADAGGYAMRKIINKYNNLKFIKCIENVSHIDYLSFLKISNCLIGNSSSGIIEAPSFKLPVVNIGTRQEGRERAENVIDVGYNKDEILNAIKKALYDKEFKEKLKKCKNPYGDGKSAQRIAKILKEIKTDKKLLQKKITY